jgi:hypothetical protein
MRFTSLAIATMALLGSVVVAHAAALDADDVSSSGSLPIPVLRPWFSAGMGTNVLPHMMNGGIYVPATHGDEPAPIESTDANQVSRSLLSGSASRSSAPDAQPVDHCLTATGSHGTDAGKMHG